jgi:putative transcriptional regulator
MHLLQEQFAVRFGFDLDTLQNWERKPDRAVMAYLRVIERMPDAASEAQEDFDAEQPREFAPAR